jgi:hypothetical protein
MLGAAGYLLGVSCSAAFVADAGLHSLSCRASIGRGAQTNMPSQFGKVLYWVGCAVALGFAFFAVRAVLLAGGYFGESPDPDEMFAYALLMMAAALGCWMAGFVIRFVLVRI